MEQKRFSKAEWIKLGLGVALIVVGIVLVQTIGWLKVYDNFDLGTLLIIIGVVCLIWCYLGLVPEREAHVYLKEDGSFDTQSARRYEARKLLPLQGFISRGFKFAIPKTTLKVFAIENGVLYVQTKSGKEFQCPLDQLIVKYHIEKDEISGYTLNAQDSEEKITFYKPGILFEDDEWKDMAGVLSEAAVVKESTLAKANKFLSKVKDFDLSDVVASTVDLAIDTVPGVLRKKSPAAMTLVDFAKSDEWGDVEEEDKTPGKKKSIWSKIKTVFGWIAVAVFLLWLAFDIWSQIEEHNAANAETEDNIESAEVEVASEDVATEGLEEFASLSEGMYIFSATFEDNGEAFLVSILPETGSGYYHAPSGTNYEILVQDENDDRTMFACSINALDGEETNMQISIVTEDWENVSGQFLNKIGQTLNYSGTSVELTAASE